MKKNSVINVSSFLFAILVLFSSCVSSTLIQTTPPGAKVYINGESVGKTPYLYSDSKIVGSTINIDLVKDGYETIYASIEKTEQANVGAIVGGLFCAIPFLWALEYKPTHKYELIPLKSKMTSQKEEIIEIENQTEGIEANTNSNNNNNETPVNSTPTKLDRLKELKKLLDEKVITEDDYELQKQRILSEI